MATIEDPISTKKARQLAADMGIKISTQAIANAARRGAIEGAEQIEGEGSSWMLPEKEFVGWLKRRRPRGPGAKKKG